MPCQWASTLRPCWRRDAHRGDRSRSRRLPRMPSRTVAAGPTCGARVTAVGHGRRAWWVALVMRAGQVFRRCLADYGLVAGAYEMLAADYNWMFDDDALATEAGPRDAAGRFSSLSCRLSSAILAVSLTAISMALAASGEWVRPLSQSKKISRGGSGGWSSWMEIVLSARVSLPGMASRGSSAVPIPARTIDSTASFPTVRNTMC